MSGKEDYFVKVVKDLEKLNSEIIIEPPPPKLELYGFKLNAVPNQRIYISIETDVIGNKTPLLLFEDICDFVDVLKSDKTVKNLNENEIPFSDKFTYLEQLQSITESRPQLENAISAWQAHIQFLVKRIELPVWKIKASRGFGFNKKTNRATAFEKTAAAYSKEDAEVLH